MNIGVVGQGYVGTAVKTIFEKYYDVDSYDLHKDSSCDSLAALVGKTTILFVCLPTPMNKNGSCNIDIVKNTIIEIDKICSNIKQNKIIAIKSTVPPGTTSMLNDICDALDIIFNPEFLTEANFIDDFKNQDRIIIGGDKKPSTLLREIYSIVFKNATIVETNSKTAEMVKYLTNSFLATKVSFANEMKMVCDSMDINFDKVVEYATYDKRLGKSHWAVPGPDGKLGFGGSCFPKDINALIHIAKELNIKENVLSAVWDTNLMVRPDKDWEELKGRAVVDEGD